MRILFLSSKDLVYSNYLIGECMRSGLLADERILVLEQDSVMPGKGKWDSLRRYLNRAGPYYVVRQVLKQYLFVLVRALARASRDTQSPFYPYHVNGHPRFGRVAPFNNLKDPANQECIRKYAPDLIVSAFSREIIPPAVIRMPRFGVVNIHPSLLPKYRGVGPVFRCMVNDDPEIGITLYYIDEKIDAGRIIEQRSMSTAGYVSEHALTMKCVEVGIDMLESFIERIKKGGRIETQGNDDRSASYFSFPTREEVLRFRRNGYVFFKLRDYFPSRRGGSH